MDKPANPWYYWGENFIVKNKIPETIALQWFPGFLKTFRFYFPSSNVRAVSGSLARSTTQRGSSSVSHRQKIATVYTPTISATHVVADRTHAAGASTFRHKLLTTNDALCDLHRGNLLSRLARFAVPHGITDGNTLAATKTELRVGG